MRCLPAALPFLLLIGCARVTPAVPVPAADLTPSAGLASPAADGLDPVAAVDSHASGPEAASVAGGARLHFPFVDQQPSVPAVTAPPDMPPVAPVAETVLPTAAADIAGGGAEGDALAPATPSLSPAPPGAPDRVALLAQAEGFARAAGVTGGLQGPDVWVTHLGDRGEGSLRLALETPGPAWVRFAVDGVIRLRRRIIVQSDKTVDGRGRRVELRGGGFLLDDVRNVIATHLVLSDGDADGVSVNRSTGIWLDHLTLARFEDGLIDVTDQSSGVTVSWCRLEDHAKGMLVGSKDWTGEDNQIRLTMHHSFFSAVAYRHPKLRYGFVHMYNVLIETWSGAAIDVSHGGQLLLEQSQLIPGGRSTQVFGLPVDLRDPPGFARTVGVDAGGLSLADDSRVVQPPYLYRAEPLSQRVMQSVRDGSGWQP
jgi:pectate lyase